MKRRLVLLAAMLATVLLIGVGQGSAHADVTAVKGSAYGYFSNIGLFGGPASTRGPTPTVTLPASGSAGGITATATTGSATYGPATFFTSGQLSVSTQGTTGPTGSVSSSTNIQNVNTSGQEPFTATSVSSRCTASEADISSGSTTINGGTLQTDSGHDANGDGDFTDVGEHRPVNVTLPANPAPNTSYNGHIHVNGSIDNFRYVFNEQIRNPDGSITVNAAHQYLLGPTAVGDLIIGQSVCGVTPPSADTTAPTVDSVSPAGKKVSPKANVTATFSEAMDEASVEAPGTFTLKRGTATVPATVTYDPSTRKATLDPSRKLRSGATYVATVTPAAKDSAGNALDQDPNTTGEQPRSWRFRVR